PNTNGRHLPPRVIAISLETIKDGRPQRLAAPSGAKLSPPLWSPDGSRFAFLNTTPTGIELWVGEAATGPIGRLPGILINAAYGEPFQWMADSRSLLCQTIPARRGAPPAEPKVSIGPNIQESFGKPAPIRTYEDLLKNPHDEDLFDYYATSQLA